MPRSLLLPLLLATLALTLGACAHAPAAAPAPAGGSAPAAGAPAAPIVPDTSSYAFDVTVTGAGPPMILIPGLSCDGSVWDTTVAHYREHYQVHVLTLAGFGGKRPAIPAPFLATVRTDLARYIRAARLDHPVVIGHSLGGFMAFWLASSEPELLGSIVAVDGVPYLAALMNASATVEQMAKPAQMMHDQVAGMTPEAWAAESNRSLAAMITDPADIERVAKGARASSPLAVADAVFEMLTTDLRAQVARIQVPTLLLQAGSDDPTSYEAQVATIHDHKVVSFPKSKHFIMLDAPADFFAAVDAFLGRAKH